MKKKSIVLVAIILISLVILVYLSSVTYKNIKTKAQAEECIKSTLKFQEYNEESVFSIDKITYFSSCNAKSETNSNSSFNIKDLYQYTDIAIFVNPIKKDFNSKNTLKSVLLSNINFNLKPSIGTPNLYYKSINDFAKPIFTEENLIEKSLLYDTTSESNLDYAKPILFNNCANPITICYVNSKIQDSYTLDNAISNLSYNGSLLRTCGITLNSIACKISFNITITNNLDESYICPINLNIPLSTESATIYDGSLTIKDNTNYKFMRIN